jgi:hypothetical protein
LTLDLLYYWQGNLALKTEADSDHFYDYISRCYRVLTFATSVQYIRLYIQPFNPADRSPVLRHKLTQTNELILRMVRHINTLQLREIELYSDPHSDPDSSLIECIRILTPNLDITKMGDWVDDMKNLTSLSALFISGHKGDDATELNKRLWTTISQLPNLRKVKAISIPILTLNTRFPYLVHLSLSAWHPLTYEERAHSAKQFSHKCLISKLYS